MKTHISEARLAAMIEEATVDAHDRSEQVTGWFVMLQDNFAVPFKTLVLGVPVMVERVDLSLDDQIVAICARDGERQPLSVLDLPLPSPAPVGSEWIEAYRRWRSAG